MCKGFVKLICHRNKGILSAQNKMQHKKSSLIPINIWFFDTCLQSSENLNWKSLPWRDVMANPYGKENVATFHRALRLLLWMVMECEDQQAFHGVGWVHIQCVSWDASWVAPEPSCLNNHTKMAISVVYSWYCINSHFLLWVIHFGYVRCCHGGKLGEGHTGIH